MNRRIEHVIVAMSIALLTCMLILPIRAFAGYCWHYTLFPATHELPWAYDPHPCGGNLANPGVGSQTIGDQHPNWHATFPDNCSNSDLCTDGPPAGKFVWGAAFVAFHRQFILDFDIERLDGGWVGGCGACRLESWDPAPNVLIPGDDEVPGTAFTHCSAGAGRPANSICNGCSFLPSTLIGDALADFSSIGEVGWELECSGSTRWHHAFHGGVSSAGCSDIATHDRPTRDPAFWMAHKKLDDIVRDWQRWKAADVVIVIDRSGSMDNDCPGGSADPGETPCKINDAKDAASLFAGLVQDERDIPGDPDEHMIGLVSFACDGGTEHLGGSLLPADGIVTPEDNVPNTDFELALDTITASGQTNIADGLQAALNVLGTGTNPHQAILLLSDGNHNCPSNTEFLDLVNIPLEIQVNVIGYGDTFGDPEDTLRTLAESHGGIFLANTDFAAGTIALEKFFVDAFGQIYDEAISEDPIMVLPAGEVSSEPFTVEICGSDSRLTIVLGSDLAQGEECDLSLMVETPAGNLVDLNDSAVETNDGKGWYFVRIPLPYQGEHTGTWTARAVRPQRVFTHGFATDAFVLLEEGVDLVREEIHRLCPTGCESVLYFEDGSATGTSAYAAALERELAAGTINMLEQSFSPEQFNDRLLGDWELIVFARQIDPTAQIYDDRLLKKLCKEEQKALITDFWRPVGFPNPIFECVGVSVGQQVNWNLIIGDGRLLTGVIPLFNPGYEVYSFSIAALPGPWLVQATNEVSGGSVVGTGTGCDSQTFFMSSLVRGFGRVEPYFVRPRTIVGQGILATFRMTESNRPIGNWDAVAATVTLERPGGGPPETYSLFDDGTNGDRAAGNNYWSREIPLVATEPGPHLLRATFFLTKDGCMIRREAEGTIMVQPEPEECLHVAGHDRLIGRRGQTVNVGTTCVQNRCLQPATYVVTVTDTQGWLCTVDEETGEFIPLAEATVATDSLEVGFGECLLETLPLLICIPPEAHLAEFTEVRYETYDVAGTLLATTSTIVQVDTGVDCNGNGLADTIDIAAGTSEDLNRNGIPDECAGDVCPTEGSCCVSNGTAGCEVLECCIEVCAADPFCCDVLWDPACAALGNQCSDCETVCGTPAMCDGDVNGDGAVDPLDAGAILARFGLDSCEEDVCQYDVNCDGAINPLDSGYVLARFGTCDPVAACALSFCPPPVPPTGACCTDGVCSEGAPSDCVYDGIYQGDGTDCAGTDCGDTEACCFIDGTCEDLDPGTCIDLGGGNQGAETTCAGGGCEGSACPTGASGDCCDPLGNGTPGCDDPTCCDAVCSIDPFCCDVAWDTLCAAQAQELCPICGGP